MKPARTLLVGAVLCYGAVAGVRFRSATVVPGANTSRILVDLVRGSQLAEQTLCVPPGVNQTQIVAVPQTVVDQVVQRVGAVEGAFYTGAQLVAQDRVLRANCRGAVTAAQSRMVGGGVDWAVCLAIAVDGSQASATCQVRKWLKSLVLAASGVDIADPSGVMIVKDRFVKTSEGWRIDDENVEFAAGYEP